MQITYRGVTVELRQLADGTYEKPNVAQFTTVQTGCTWLDACRVPASVEDVKHVDRPNCHGKEYEAGIYGGGNHSTKGIAVGRFPANLIVSDDVLNDGRVSKSGAFNGPVCRRPSGFANVGADKGSSSPNGPRHGDEGSYSRFFSLDAWAKTFPWLIVAKASKSEKNKGLDTFPDNHDSRIGDGIGGAPSVGGKRELPQKNIHTTVKPLTLMAYMITLGSRPGDLVLDPFMGSGTTGIAAKMLGRSFIGMEREEEYVKIAEARIAAHHAPEPAKPTL